MSNQNKPIGAMICFGGYIYYSITCQKCYNKLACKINKMDNNKVWLNLVTLSKKKKKICMF